MQKRSLRALNAVNFFQAEMVGVIVPVLNVLLKQQGWNYQSIGFATAAGGVGTLIFQTPAGWITDRVNRRRALFAIAALIAGACFVAMPWFSRSRIYVDLLMFVSGAAQSFFAPVLAALALGLVGHDRISRTIGVNQGWNHAGNIVAALAAMALVSAMGLGAVFYSVAAGSLLAGASVLWIRERDLDERRATGLTNAQQEPSWRYLFHDRRILFLFISIFLFHLANAPILPTTALYVKKLGGSDALMTATVLTAQSVMVPVSYLAGRLCDSWGRKPTMAIAFWALPLRIFSYSLVSVPSAVVYLQALDGIGAGIYGVAVAAFSADLTRGKGGFNTLMGVFATALATGGVLGPVLSGTLVEHWGFRATFYAFSALTAVGALVFTTLVPETSGISRQACEYAEKVNTRSLS